MILKKLDNVPRNYCATSNRVTILADSRMLDTVGPFQNLGNHAQLPWNVTRRLGWILFAVDESSWNHRGRIPKPRRDRTLPCYSIYTDGGIEAVDWVESNEFCRWLKYMRRPYVHVFLRRRDLRCRFAYHNAGFSKFAATAFSLKLISTVFVASTCTLNNPHCSSLWAVKSLSYFDKLRSTLFMSNAFRWSRVTGIPFNHIFSVSGLFWLYIEVRIANIPWRYCELDV